MLCNAFSLFKPDCVTHVHPVHDKALPFRLFQTPRMVSWLHRLRELGGGQVFGRSEGRFGSVGDSHLLERRRGGLLLLSVRQRCCHRKSGQGGKQAARGDTAQRGVFAASNICVGVRHDED